MMLSRGRGPVFGMSAMRGNGPGNIDWTRMGGVQRGPDIGRGIFGPTAKPQPPKQGTVTADQGLRQPPAGPTTQLPVQPLGQPPQIQQQIQQQIAGMQQQPTQSQQMLQDHLLRRMLMAPGQQGPQFGQRPNPTLMGYGQQTPPLNQILGR